MVTVTTFPEIVTTDAPLAQRTSFGIGGVAKQFIQPRSVEELAEVVGFLNDTGTPYKILGGGTNLLIRSREITEPVLHLGRMRSMRFNGAAVDADAGVPLGRFITECGVAGLAGPEALAGVPGTVGGAAVMNAGGKHGYIASMVRGVTVLYGASLRTLPADKIRFDYRTSSLRGNTVAAVSFALKKADRAGIAQRRRSILAEKKLGQPLKARSAGCVFKNPPGCHAGQLIDAAGLKGARAGGALVSPVHANFIVNAGGATADDVLTLIERIQKKILKIYNLALELEIEMW